MKGYWKLSYKTFHRQGTFTGIEKTYGYSIILFYSSFTESDREKAKSMAEERLKELRKDSNITSAELMWIEPL